MIDFELMAHQRDAVFRSTIEKDLFLAWEVGTGKTCTTIQMIRDRCKEEGRLKRTLILAPKVVLNNWKKEFEKFSNIPKNYIFTLTGALRKRIEFMESIKGFNAVVITNYDALVNPAFVGVIRNWDPEILVCDESHYVKSYKSKRAKNVELISSGCKNKYLLTGTPILKDAMDLFMQYNILDNGKTFGKNFWAFKAKYFMDANEGWKHKASHFPKFVARPGAYKEMMKSISKKTLRALKKDCLDLPELITQNLEVELGPAQSKAYKEMKKFFITYIEGEACVAQQAMTKALRLQQIISGYAKTDDGEVKRFSKNPRLDTLKDLLTQLTPNHKVIVWACFKENYKMIREVCDEIGVKSVELHGEVGQKDRESALVAFDDDPSVRVLIGNQGAGGVGVNLVSASYSIWYSRGFKLGDDIQSRGRNHRRGSEQHDKITHINLVAPQTVDEMISDALSSKLDISNRVLDFVKKERKKYGF